MRPIWRIGRLAFLGVALSLAFGCGGGGKKPDDVLLDGKASAVSDEEKIRIGYAQEEARKARNALDKDDKDAAIDHFERASRFHEAEPAYHLAVGQLQLEQGRLDKAEVALVDALKALQKAPPPANPGEEMLYRRMRAEICASSGDLLRKKGLNAEAINAYQEAVEAFPGMARAQFELGDLYLNRYRYAAAEGRFREALKIDPSMLKAQVGLAIAYHREGEHARAWKEIQDIESKGYDVNEDLRESVLQAIRNQRSPG